MYYDFYVDFLNYDICMVIHADDLQYDPINDVYNFYIGDDIVFTIGGDIYKMNITFSCKSHGGHITYDGTFIVDFENGSDADFDTHSTEVQNGEGYYNSEGRYVSYHKYD